MKKILNFLEQIKKQKKRAFIKRITEFSRLNSADGWNGNILQIEDMKDVFLYISEDKKSIKASIGEFDARIPFSFLIYSCHVLYKAAYTNGGLEFVGFYNSDYLKVKEIPFESVKIIGFEGGFNFAAQRNPDFSLDLKHKEGKKISSYRGNPFYIKSCQGVIDGIWELEKFFYSWYKVFEDFEHNWYEIRSRSPKSLM